MAEKRKAERRCWSCRSARPAWCGESCIAWSPVPSRSRPDPSPEHLRTRLILRVT